MESFTYRQKSAAFRAFLRGWLKAIEDETVWRPMSAKEKALYLKGKVWEEMQRLPAKKKSWWERLMGRKLIGGDQ